MHACCYLCALSRAHRYGGCLRCVELECYSYRAARQHHTDQHHGSRHHLSQPASEIVSLNETLGGNTFPTLSYPNYRDMRDRNTVLSGLMAYRFLPASLGLPGNNQRVWGYLVTGNYFDLLGVGAARVRADPS